MYFYSIHNNGIYSHAQFEAFIIYDLVESANNEQDNLKHFF